MLPNKVCRFKDFVSSPTVLIGGLMNCHTFVVLILVFAITFCVVLFFVQDILALDTDVMLLNIKSLLSRQRPGYFSTIFLSCFLHGPVGHYMKMINILTYIQFLKNGL